MASISRPVSHDNDRIYLNFMLLREDPINLGHEDAAQVRLALTQPHPEGFNADCVSTLALCIDGCKFQRQGCPIIRVAAIAALRLRRRRAPTLSSLRGGLGEAPRAPLLLLTEPSCGLGHPGNGAIGQERNDGTVDHDALLPMADLDLG